MDTQDTEGGMPIPDGDGPGHAFAPGADTDLDAEDVRDVHDNPITEASVRESVERGHRYLGADAALLTVRQAATTAGVSPKTIRRWIAINRLEATLTPGAHGHEYLITPEALTAARDSTETRVQRVVDRGPTVEELMALLARAEARHAEVLAAVEGLRAELHEIRMLPAPASDAQVEAPPRSWWARLFGG